MKTNFKKLKKFLKQKGNMRRNLDHWEGRLNMERAVWVNTTDQPLPHEIYQSSLKTETKIIRPSDSQDNAF